MSHAIPHDQIALALSDPLRLRILDLLAAGRNERCPSPDNPELPRSICAVDLQRQLDPIAPSKLAYHLKELREAGLIKECKQGKWVYYHIDHQALQEFLQTMARRYSAFRNLGGE